MHKKAARSVAEPVEVIAGLYEAVLTDSWPAALCRLGDLANGADEAAIINWSAVDERVESGTVSGRVFSQEHLKHYLSYYSRIEPGRPLLNAMKCGELWMNHERLPAELLNRGEYYHDLYMRNGVRYVAGWILEKTPMGYSTITFLRSPAKGPWTRPELVAAQRIVPHLDRALKLQKRLRPLQERCIAIDCAFEALDVGVVMLDADLRVLKMNARAHQLLAGSKILALVGPRLVARESHAHLRLNEMLRGTLRTAACRPDGSGCGYLRLPRADGKELWLQAAPLQARTPGAIGQPGVMLTIIDPGESQRHCLHALTRLFGVTEAEGLVVLDVAAGKTAAGIARERKVSVTTVRSQIRNALEKTGYHKISDLGRVVALLS